MQNIVIDKPYKFVPPCHGNLWPKFLRLFLRGYLERSHGVRSVEWLGVERLKKSIEAGHGIMITPNHCRPCDPMVLVHLWDAVGTSFYTMASGHLFMQSRFQTFLLRRAGVFSIYREGMDREALKCAVQILADARKPLVLFPEGVVSRTNDRLNHLMDGTVFIARNAAKQRAGANPTGKVVIHPVAIRYFFEGDIGKSLVPVLENIERRLSWKPQSNKSLVDRIYKVGDALLTLKEIEYFEKPQTGDLKQRLTALIDHLLVPLEQEWLKGKRENNVVARVKNLRAAILPEMVSGEIAEEERGRRWQQLADMYLAQQLFFYPPEYFKPEATPEKLMETVERFEEDLTDHVTIHGPIHAVMEVGDAIEVSPRPRTGSGDRSRHGEDSRGSGKNDGGSKGKAPYALRGEGDAMNDVTGKNRLWKWGAALVLLSVLIADIWLVAWQRLAPASSFWALPVAKFCVRISVIVLAMVEWFWTQSLIGSGGVKGDAIGDALHELSRPWNDYLQEHPRLANMMLMVSSGFIDLFGLFLIGAGIFGRTLRPFIALLMVFVFRQICQAVCALPIPPKMIWRNPGFPSLLVTYGVANDFFISGHTAIAVLGAIEVYRILPWWCAVAAGMIALLEAGMVIVLRAHYTMDVLAAVVAAWCAADFAMRLCMAFGL